jgi:hypothetical protein
VSRQGPAGKSERADAVPASRIYEHWLRTVYFRVTRFLPPAPGQHLARFVLFNKQNEPAIKRDILAISCGIVGLGAVLWIFWGNPSNVTRTHARFQELNVDPELKLVSERSPYMRTER